MNTTILGILMDAFFIALLLWCSYTDLRKRIVSNVTIALLLCLGIARTVFVALAGSSWWTYPAGMVLVVLFLFAWLRGHMGAGDVKLVLSIGLYLGLLNTVIAFALMVPLLVILMVRSQIKTMTLKGTIPLAPVLAFGAIGAVALGYLYALFQF
jgi:Flp pilus assembly protein protease CpaA